MFNVTATKENLKIIHPHKNANFKKLNKLSHLIGDKFPKMKLLEFLFNLFISNIPHNTNTYINDEVIYFVNNKHSFKYEGMKS